MHQERLKACTSTKKIYNSQRLGLRKGKPPDFSVVSILSGNKCENQGLILAYLHWEGTIMYMLLMQYHFKRVKEVVTMFNVIAPDRITKGRLEMICLSGSYMLTDNGGCCSQRSGLSISSSGPNDRVLGGGVGGLLIAATPVQVIAGSFMNSG